MGMLLQRHYEARDASATAKRDALLAEVEAARLQQAEVAIQRVRAAQEADDEDDVPCAACVALHGARPCSVECYVKAGFQAENFDAHIARIEAELVATEAAAKAEAETTVAAELAAQVAVEAAAKAEAEAAQAEQARLAAEAQAAEEARQAEAAALAKAEADRKAAEAAELAALEEATRPDESKPESKSTKPSRK